MEIKEFNDLPYKKRLEINYYATQQKMTLMYQMIIPYNDEVTPRYKKMVTKWRHDLEVLLNVIRKELENMDDEL